jgi:hypothetical protein
VAFWFTAAIKPRSKIAGLMHRAVAGPRSRPVIAPQGVGARYIRDNRCRIKRRLNRTSAARALRGIFHLGIAVGPAKDDLGDRARVLEQEALQ